MKNSRRRGCPSRRNVLQELPVHVMELIWELIGFCEVDSAEYLGDMCSLLHGPMKVWVMNFTDDDERGKILKDGLDQESSVCELIMNFGRVPDSFSFSMLESNQSLVHLQLQYSSMGGNTLNSLFEALWHNKKLRKLNLEGTIRNGDASIAQIRELIKVNKTLEELILDLCDLTSANIASLADIVREFGSPLFRLSLEGVGEVDVASVVTLVGHTQLNSLSLNQKEMTGSLTEVFRALGNNKFLEDLVVPTPSKPCRKKAIDALRQSLVQCTALTSLSLTECGIEVIDASFAEALQKSQLRYLNLELNFLTNCDGLSKALKLNCALQELDLAGCQCDEDVIATLFVALETNTNLVKMDLLGNRLPHDESVFNLLAKNHTIRKLDLVDCLIDDSVLLRLEEGLAQNTGLHSLNLSCNKGISDFGLQKFVLNGLGSNHTLRILNLGNIPQLGLLTMFGLNFLMKLNQLKLTCLNIGLNIIALPALSLLCEGLVDDKSLKRLYLSRVDMEDEECIILATALRRNTTLRELDLTENWIGTGGCKSLVELLSVNQSLQTLSITSHNIDDEEEAYANEPHEPAIDLAVLQQLHQVTKQIPGFRLEIQQF